MKRENLNNFIRIYEPTELCRLLYSKYISHPFLLSHIVSLNHNIETSQRFQLIDAIHYLIRANVFELD